MIRTDASQAKQVYDELGFIKAEDESVRALLERKFYAAVQAQRDAIMSQNENDQRFANAISHLTYHLGCHNTYLPAHEYFTKLWEPKFVSGEELKRLQVEKMRTQLGHRIDADSQQSSDDKAEAQLRLAALEQYVACTTINDEVVTTDHEALIDDDATLSRGEKLKRFTQKAAAALTFAAITLGLSATTGHAATENSIDDESDDPDNGTIKKPRRIVAPIKLAEPAGGKVEPLVRVEGSPQSTRTPDGSIKLATPTVIEPPSRIEASPNISTIPNVPNTPPVAPAPAIEAAPAAPIPEVIIDPGLAGETLWTAAQLEQVRANFGVYHEVQKESGVPWEVMAALHVREFSLKRVNPPNGQGIYQLYSTGIYFAPGPVSDEEFKQQTLLAANFLLGKAKDNSRVGGPVDFSNPDKIKDVLFAYNGLASQYFQQASRLGFSLGAEGSPYVMNMADDRRNSNLNPAWGQILVDNGPLGRANQAPGAWPLIEGLREINQIARDQMAAKQAAEAASATEAARVAAEAAAEAEKNAKRASQQPELQKKETANWVLPIENGIINSHYGDRGGVHHDGIDFPAKLGTEFRAIEDGIVIELAMEDVTGKQWCIAALEGIQYYGPLPDPVQKTVMVKHLIGDDVYISRYDHLSEFTVEVGDIIKAGQAVGKTGSSGCSTGRHAHFGVKKNGRSINPALLFQ